MADKDNTQKNIAFCKALSGAAKMDCVYLFFTKSGSNDSAATNKESLDDTITPGAIFSDPKKYGGVLRITNATPTTTAEGGIGLLASSDNGESFGETFADGCSVYAAAVVVSGAKKEDDVIFCVNKFDTPITKAANAAVIVNAKVVLA